MAAGNALAQPEDEDQDSHILAAFARPAADRSAPEQPSLSPPAPRQIDQARFLLFASTDIWREGGFASGGVLWAPSGLDRDGPVLKLMFGGGLYQYNSGALGNVTVVGRELSAAVLPGWRFVRGDVTVTVFLGYDFQQHRLTPDDPSAGLRGSYHGVRTGFELWYQPIPWAMVAADASVSSIGPGYNVRLAPASAPSMRSMSARRCRRSAPTATIGSFARACMSPDCAPGRWNGRPAPASRATATTTAAPTASLAC